MISKMSEQLLKLFAQQGELDDTEKDRMADTRYAFGLLLHAANIKEYKMSDDIDKVYILNTLQKTMIACIMIYIIIIIYNYISIIIIIFTCMGYT